MTVIGLFSLATFKGEIWDSMSNRTVTRSIEFDVEPDTVLATLTDPKQIPRWAPGFVDEVESVSSHEWRIKKRGMVFSMQMVSRVFTDS